MQSSLRKRNRKRICNHARSCATAVVITRVIWGTLTLQCPVSFFEALQVVRLRDKGLLACQYSCQIWWHLGFAKVCKGHPNCFDSFLEAQAKITASAHTGPGNRISRLHGQCVLRQVSTPWGHRAARQIRIVFLQQKEIYNLGSHVRPHQKIIWPSTHSWNIYSC